MAPGVMEQHFTVGWTSERANGNILSLSLMYAPSEEVAGTNSFDPTILNPRNTWDDEVAADDGASILTLGHTDNYDIHLAIFNEPKLTSLMENAGLVDIKAVKPEQQFL